MSIDWDKPLECERGTVMVIRREEDETLNVRTMDGLVSWWANGETGEPLDGWMPRVYNKKPEPKANEYWLIKDVHDHERVVYFDGQMFTDGPTCNEAYLEVTLVTKMERVEE